jgi:hypothetical protein
MWTRIHLGYLALAHAQALLDTNGIPIVNSTDNAAWMDVAPYSPKGNNNNGSDVNKTSLVFSRTDVQGSNVVNGFAGESWRAFTGAARIGTLSAVEHTTHNGQLCGIVDVNGNQWDITPGLTNNTGTNAGYKAFSDLDDYTAVSSNAGITGAANVISLAVDVADDGVWWGEADLWTRTFNPSLLEVHSTPPQPGPLTPPVKPWRNLDCPARLVPVYDPKLQLISLAETLSSVSNHRSDVTPAIAGSGRFWDLFQILARSGVFASVC